MIKFPYVHYVNDLNENLLSCSKDIKVSFEFFPPKTVESEKKLWSVVDLLAPLNPSFFSVTYGANSGERERTHQIVKQIQKKTNIPSAAHLTCIDASKKELYEIATDYWNNGITHIVALRGDVLDCSEKPKMFASDLVSLLKEVADFEIAVAGYPECHPESRSVKEDIYYLKKKIDAGATKVITQFFFDVEKFLIFRDLCVKNNIDVEIIPGILPITNYTQLLKFIKLTNVYIPKYIHYAFSGLNNDSTMCQLVGSSIAIDMVRILHKEGVNNFHFYTLNRAELSFAICHILGIQNISEYSQSNSK